MAEKQKTDKQKTENQKTEKQKTGEDKSGEEPVTEDAEKKEPKVEWSPENEKILVDWCDIAKCYKWLHTRAHQD